MCCSDEFLSFQPSGTENRKKTIQNGEASQFNNTRIQVLWMYRA
jgi:hypothetical protein